MPATWWSAKRIRIYLLFDATGIVYLLVALLGIEIVSELGAGPEAWGALMERLKHPVYIAFHVLSLASVIFVAVRFFRLFPKAQPPTIGPAKPPPAPVIHAMLYVVWLGITALMTAILAGVLF
jgi:fumarate reductase subunit C